MKHWFPHLTRAAAIAAFCLPAAAQSVPGDRIAADIAFFEAGILCAPEVITTRPAPDTVAGVTNVIEEAPEMISHGRMVPGALGIGFGVRAQTDGMFYGDVTMVVTHPPMGPEGTTRQSYQTSLGPEAPSIAFYQLEYDYEIVPGDWTFTAMSGDDVIYAARFTLVSPVRVPELAQACGYEDLLS